MKLRVYPKQRIIRVHFELIRDFSALKSFCKRLNSDLISSNIQSFRSLFFFLPRQNRVKWAGGKHPHTTGCPALQGIFKNVMSTIQFMKLGGHRVIYHIHYKNGEKFIA